MAEFIVPRDLQVLASTAHRFSIFDFRFLIEELSSWLNPGQATPIACSRSGEAILAGLKNFDFRGTIGGIQKSGQSEYTNQERNSVSAPCRAIGQVAIDSTEIS